MKVIKESISDKAFHITASIILFIIGIVMLYPFYYLLIYSLNEPLDAMRGGLYFWPRRFSTISYRLVWATHNIMQGAKVSLARTIIGTTVSLFCTSMLSYVLSRPHLVWRRFFNRLFVVSMYLSSGLIPYFLTLNAYGFLNTFWVYIVPGLIGVFNMILIRTYMQELPASLWESAAIDGAREFTVFSRIFLPLCVPVLAVVCIYNAVGHWNAWFDAMIFNNASRQLHPLQLILMNTLKSTTVTSSRDVPLPRDVLVTLTPESLRAAITMIVTIPIVCVYPFFQRHFTQGIMLGAVKG